MGEGIWELEMSSEHVRGQFPSSIIYPSPFFLVPVFYAIVSVPVLYPAPLY